MSIYRLHQTGTSARYADVVLLIPIVIFDVYGLVRLFVQHSGPVSTTMICIKCFDVGMTYVLLATIARRFGVKYFTEMERLSRVSYLRAQSATLDLMKTRAILHVLWLFLQLMGHQHYADPWKICVFGCMLYLSSKYREYQRDYVKQMGEGLTQSASPGEQIQAIQISDTLRREERGRRIGSVLGVILGLVLVYVIFSGALRGAKLGTNNQHISNKTIP